MLYDGWNAPGCLRRGLSDRDHSVWCFVDERSVLLKIPDQPLNIIMSEEGGVAFNKFSADWGNYAQFVQPLEMIAPKPELPLNRAAVDHGAALSKQFVCLAYVDGVADVLPILFEGQADAGLGGISFDSFSRQPIG